MQLDPKSKIQNRKSKIPKDRDCQIYERHILQEETQECLAAEFGLTQQRVGQIAAAVEAWIARHPEHPLAQRMRLRCHRHWQAIWSRSIESFDRSREDRTTSKERVARRAAADGERPVATVTERTVRQQNGDPRFLTIAARVAEREDRQWTDRREQPVEDGLPRPSISALDGPGGPSSLAAEFAYLPPALRDLELLACGLSPGGTTPVAMLFEQRCAEAFRCLGFDVRELGQGCGRVADCLAIAAPERFAVIIDAKVRRGGYTLGTDDRQFCEYATRHARELALSGIERVYFAVVGHGFRREDLDKLAGFMTGAPVRSVSFIETLALMRLVNDSIHNRREFRLNQLDRLLFGNKIIDLETLAA